MKTTQKFLVFAFVLFSFTTIKAQHGYGNGNGYGNSGRMSQMDQQSQPEKPKEIPVEETVSKIMERMTPAINLDVLQEIAISKVLKESINAQGVLLKQNYTQEEQLKNFLALSETTDRKINEFLNEDQKAKYTAFKEEKQNQKSDKSDDKKGRGRRGGGKRPE